MTDKELDAAYRRGEPMMTDEAFDKYMESRPPLPTAMRKISQLPDGQFSFELKYDGVHVICKLTEGYITHVYTASGKNDVSGSAKQSPHFHRKFGSFTGEIRGEALYPIAYYSDKTPGQRRAKAAQHLLHSLPEAEALCFVPWSTWEVPRVPVTDKKYMAEALISVLNYGFYWTAHNPTQPAWRPAGCPFDVDGIVLLLGGVKVAYKGPLFREAYDAHKKS